MDSLDIYLAAAPLGIAATAAVGLLVWNPGRRGRADRRAAMARPAQRMESETISARLAENERVIGELKTEISRLRGNVETLTTTSIMQSYSFSPLRPRSARSGIPDQASEFGDAIADPFFTDVGAAFLRFSPGVAFPGPVREAPQ